MKRNGSTRKRCEIILLGEWNRFLVTIRIRLHHSFLRVPHAWFHRRFEMLLRLQRLRVLRLVQGYPWLLGYSFVYNGNWSLTQVNHRPHFNRCRRCWPREKTSSRLLIVILLVAAAVIAIQSIWEINENPHRRGRLCFLILRLHRLKCFFEFLFPTISPKPFFVDLLRV